MMLDILGTGNHDRNGKLTMSSPVVRCSHALESLLASCIPAVQLQDIQQIKFKIYNLILNAINISIIFTDQYAWISCTS